MNDILNRTIYTEWVDYIENDGKIKTYKCPACRMWSGKLKYRRVTERTGGAHKEFTIECDVCRHKGGVYWSKILAEKTWEAESDPYYESIKAVKKR